MHKFGYLEFLTYFVDLTDPREDRGRKRLLAGWNLDNLKGILLAFQAT